jgi:hypothetical protein
MGQKSRTPHSSPSSPTSKTSAPSGGLHYSNIIYAFIFIMYAVVICVVIFMLTSRWVQDVFYVRILLTFHIAVDFYTCAVQSTREGKGGRRALLPSPFLPCREEVNSFCPGEGGRG